mmetsp:Transcript_8891/g.24149  ORF Transcript_8891/g.24149 Transcript_8891/m.24149 type:complete len:81 (-) Transcript_8891:1286-1528(-)
MSRTLCTCGREGGDRLEKGVNGRSCMGLMKLKSEDDLALLTRPSHATDTHAVLLICTYRSDGFPTQHSHQVVVYLFQRSN